ncbi:MAG: hypothetical protein JWN32_1849 [Solirubrobacterales bacterium]|jgi:hypothetical protein|nr:hypothetical protein [Solirubrobacterales bacterium]
MTPLAAVDGLVLVAVAVVAALVLGVIVLGRSQRGGHSGFLEWDPVARTAWRHDQESVDVEEMLALHNGERRRRGLDALTMEEYLEQVRRGTTGR